MDARRFVRRDGENQSWLVEGAVEVQADPLTWLDRQLLRIPRDRVQRLETSHPDGEVLIVERATPTDVNFAIQDLPEGFEEEYAGAANVLGSSLSFLRFDDVAAEEELLLDAEVTVFDALLFDGLRILVRTRARDAEVWATLEASVDENAPEDTVDAVRDEASEINGRLQGWAFMLGAGQAENVQKRMDDLIKPVESAEPVPADPAG